MESSRLDCQKVSRNFTDSSWARRRCSHFFKMTAQEITDARMRRTRTPITTGPEWVTISM
jgi:hypothetical protein